MRDSAIRRWRRAAPVEACGCVPGYPEMQAYVARILGVMGAAAELPPGASLEVRLVSQG